MLWFSSSRPTPERLFQFRFCYPTAEVEEIDSNAGTNPGAKLTWDFVGDDLTDLLRQMRNEDVVAFARAVYKHQLLAPPGDGPATAS